MNKNSLGKFPELSLWDWDYQSINEVWLYSWSASYPTKGA